MKRLASFFSGVVFAVVMYASICAAQNIMVNGGALTGGYGPNDLIVAGGITVGDGGVFSNGPVSAKGDVITDRIRSYSSDAGISIISNLAPAAAGADLILDTNANRTAGNLLQINNHGVPTGLSVDWQGNITATSLSTNYGLIQNLLTNYFAIGNNFPGGNDTLFGSMTPGTGGADITLKSANVRVAGDDIVRVVNNDDSHPVAKIDYTGNLTLNGITIGTASGTIMSVSKAGTLAGYDVAPLVFGSCVTTNAATGLPVSTRRVCVVTPAAPVAGQITSCQFEADTTKLDISVCCCLVAGCDPPSQSYYWRIFLD